MILSGRKVSIAYEFTVDGQLIKSVDSGKPFSFIYGKEAPDQIPPAFYRRIRGLKAGDRKTIQLGPKEGYGVENPKSFREMPKSKFATKYHYIGKQINSGRDGKYLATVKEIRSNTLLVNFNHPFAGKKLRYDVRIVSVEKV